LKTYIGTLQRVDKIIMKIGIDISQIAYKGTGVSRFTEGLVHAILDNNKLDEWTFFFSSFRNSLELPLKEKIAAHHHTLVILPLPPTALSLLSNDLRFATRMITNNLHQFTELDWFITSDWIELPMPIKKATIVHDLVFKKYPQTVHKTILRAQMTRFKYLTNESKIIFTDSQATTNDLRQEYNIDSSRTVINYPGVEVTKLRSNAQQIDHLEKFDITKPYILSVGKQEPRKNIQKLITVFQKMAKPTQSLQLIIVGPEGWNMPDEKSNDAIKFIGYVSGEELATLYANALCFAYPSIYEGFGYPIIEAMKYGCPVATSNTSSIPEVAGDAAVFFDPHSEQSIQSVLEQLTGSEKLRAELVEKGLLQAQKFTWKSYYNTLITSLNEKTS